MRKEIYPALAERLRSAACGVQYVGLWNENELKGEAEKAYALPAVLVEFGPIAWQQRANGVKSAPVTIRLHVITQAASASDAVPPQYALCEAVVDAVSGAAGESFSRLQHAGTISGHKHEGRQCDVEVFVCEARDVRGAERKQYTTAQSAEITVRQPANE